ncbi:conjugal transfer protein [Streptococcus mutans]|uniref:conjugal transfer protein n=1 Tax=Streptococcus mutans TaxID=1309 RepID=UPI001CFD9310|nr:conjugal transfer protein [Streptococcus mutans]MCB4988846.1 conjugal transfer protein [Streptococcus mutans]MCB5012186.1 conjugal transfer protein [Streptococcus mutans]MCB5024120.1 conjugal transfer protein [Streptococcus mutans]
MAKVGLNMGEKLQIADKGYRVVDGLKIDAVLGKVTYRTNEGQDLIYEDDTSQPRRQDGTYPQVPTGEVRGTVLGLHSSVQHETLFITITDMPLSDIEALGLKPRDEVVLDNIVVTYSSVGGNDNYKLFASGLKKAGAAASTKGTDKNTKGDNN